MGMPASSLLALIDDISSIMDDVALLTKVAAKQTSGVVGDDLALNAQQASGVHAERELPVVWAVAKGSLINKAILVPAALLISAFLPQAILPLLMIGGLYLCYEGVEKVAHKLLHSPAEDAKHHAEVVAHVADPNADVVALERDKIKGAIRTDFILSAEIIVIALGTMATASIGKQVLALSLVAVAITVLVYGLVGGIVKLDDLGEHLHAHEGTTRGAELRRRIGKGILLGAPMLMKSLSVLGTAAMFTVGGSIIVHGIPPLEHPIEALDHRVSEVAGWLGTVASLLAEAAVGIASGAVVLGLVLLGKRVFRKAAPLPDATP